MFVGLDSVQDSKGIEYQMKASQWKHLEQNSVYNHGLFNIKQAALFTTFEIC